MVLFTIIGAIIGAGFASGQEIYLFFYRFGINGIWGILICNILMCLTIYKTLDLIYSKNISSYKDFLNNIFSNNILLSKITNFIVNFFLCVTFFIMIAGFGTYLSQVFNINQIWGSAILAVISYFVFLKNMKSFTKINCIIIPILISVIVLVGLKNFQNIEYENIKMLTNKEVFWIIEAIIYASYNLILVIPVLINLKGFLINKRQILFISIGVSVIMIVLTVFEFFLLSNIKEFNNVEMPLVYVIERNFSEFFGVYGVAILIAIFTTAISVGLSFLNNITKNEKSFPHFAGILCISSVVFSPIGFSKLVAILFPVFGFLGLVQMGRIVKK